MPPRLTVSRRSILYACSSRLPSPSSGAADVVSAWRCCVRPQPVLARTLTATSQARTWRVDSYMVRQQQAHAAAKALRTQRARKEGKKSTEPGQNPARGITTPFVLSFDGPPPPTWSQDASSAEPAATHMAAHSAANPAGADGSDRLNFRVSRAQLQDQLDRSKFLADPTGRYDIENEPGEARRAELAQLIAKDAKEHAAGHDVAVEAVNRIMSLDLGSARHRYGVNVDRCIEEFGRHNTDTTLPARDGKPQKDKFRAGLDVGSSEVQIAIMTAKIRRIANALDATGKKDLHTKRNMRLLVHKRQKLLKYLYRKEKGGPRWQHVIETLGLTEATWKGEISM